MTESEKLTPSKFFKKMCGMTTRQVAQETGMSYRTLEDWYRSGTKQDLLNLLVDGFKYRKAKEHFIR